MKLATSLNIGNTLLRCFDYLWEKKRDIYEQMEYVFPKPEDMDQMKAAWSYHEWMQAIQ